MRLSVRRKILGIGVLALGSAVLTSVTVIFGAVPLRVLRLSVSSAWYWAIVLLTTGLMVAGSVAAHGGLVVAAAYLILATAVGAFAECEEHGFSLVGSGLVAVGISGMTMAGGFVLWLSRQDAGWLTSLIGNLEQTLAQLPGWAENTRFEAKDIIFHLPSLALAGIVLGLFVSLLFQRRLTPVGGGNQIRKHRLSRFVVPDFFIWTLLLALAGAFVPSASSWVHPTAMNFLNISAVIFFLQGLAVVTSYFSAFRVGWFWQTLWTVILVSQLFLLVSLVGVADYWIDFRSRLTKRATELDHETSKE